MKATDWIALCGAGFSGIAAVAAVIATVIARRAARAAERSAEIAARGVRAWVVVQGRVEDSSDLHEHIVLRALVTLVNNGKTPALELRTWQKIELRTVPPSNADYPRTLTGGSKGVLGPDERCQLPAVLEPSHAEYREVVAGRSVVFLFGVAEYQDLVFKKRNRTSYCLHYVPESKEYTYSDSGNLVS